MLNRAMHLLLLFTILLSQGCVNVQTHPGNRLDAHGPHAKTPELDIAAQSSNSAVKSASRVYRDPITGKFTGPPPKEGELQTPTSDRQSVILEPSHEFKETAIEGGGSHIHLQGRFRSYTSVTKDSEGKTTIHCKDELHKK